MIDRLEGKICRILFPFTDKDAAKRRPALAMGEPDAHGDVRWAFITTKSHPGLTSVPIQPGDLMEGSLPRESHLFPDKIFTIHKSRIDHYYATVKPAFLSKLRKRAALAEARTFSRLTHLAQRPGDDPIRLKADADTEASALNRGKEQRLKGADVVPSTLQPLNRPARDESRSSTSPAVIPYAGRVFDEDEVEAAVSATLDFWLTLGKEGDAFESELAAFLGVRRSILTNSGSSANLLAFTALTSHKLPPEKRIRPGDEVITCAAGFPTTVAPILQNGAVPVFLDNDPATGNADLSRLEEAYVPGKTKAVMMAHALGNPFDLATVLAFCRKHDLWLIEDNCDALGCTYSLPLEWAKSLGLEHLIKKAEANVERLRAAGGGVERLKREKVERMESPSTPQPFNPSTSIPFIENGMLTAYTGSFGDLSTQSFYPPHHLTMGEGGAVNIAKDMKLKVLVESFRDWGRDCWCASGVDNTCKKRFGWQLGELPEGYDHKYIYSHLGYNLKPLDPQAAIGRVQLKKLPAFIEARKRNWELLRRGLSGLEHVLEFALPTHAVRWRKPTEVEGLKAAPGGVEVLKGSMVEEISCFEWEIPSTLQPIHRSTTNSGCTCSPSWFGFMMLVKETAPFSRTDLARHLDEHKIGNRMLFGGNLLRQPAFVQLRRDNPAAFRVVGGTQLNGGTEEGLKGKDPSTHQPLNLSTSALPGADRIMNQAIFIGTYPGLTPAQIDRMVAVIRAFVEQKQLAWR